MFIAEISYHADYIMYINVLRVHSDRFTPEFFLANFKLTRSSALRNLWIFILLITMDSQMYKTYHWSVEESE
jgi:hypothetical protein